MTEDEAQAAALKAFEEAMLQGDDDMVQYKSESRYPDYESSFPSMHEQSSSTVYSPLWSNIETDEMKLMESLRLVDSMEPNQQLEMLQGLMSGLQSSHLNSPAYHDEHLLQVLQQQQLQQQQMTAAAEFEAEHKGRPVKHYLTVSLNGTILEATQTVTGFEPEALLMTSVFDSLFDEDLPGFLAIKTQFWDQGETDVEIFIRRQSIDGDWIWLVSKAVSFVNNNEIRGIILEESSVCDEPMAIEINRITRITAILIQAVEATLQGDSKPNSIDRETEENQNEKEKFHAQLLDNDMVAYRSIIDQFPTSGQELPCNAQDLERLMRVFVDGSGHQGGTEVSERESLSYIGGMQKKSFDPYSVIESVRKGVCLDLGLTKMNPEDIKLLVLVLTGCIPAVQVARMVRYSLQLGKGVLGLTDNFVLDCEKSSRNHLSLNAIPQLCPPLPVPPPPISVINLSYTYIGNYGIELFSDILYKDSTSLKTIDLSFCNVDDKGFLALARAISKRKRKGLPPLKGVILSGNYFSSRSASEIGSSLSPSDRQRKKVRRHRSKPNRNGYETDSAESDDEDEDDFRQTSHNGNKKKKNQHTELQAFKDDGLQVLHVANASMSAESVRLLLESLGADNTIQELNLAANNFGSAGAIAIVSVLEKKNRSRFHTSSVALPFLDRLDMSCNNLGDDGTTQLTRAISKRSDVNLVDLKLSSNSISSVGIETFMNKLLQHSIVSLSLDKNMIGDQGCQLVAASLQSMKSLSRLNLGFNEIGSRGITSLMRSLVTCESLTYLGLSGNIVRISGAIALAFCLLQHPRLEELDLDNCCLGQAAQCHIVAGVISNRWVPMKQLRGYALGPPMAAIGALEIHMASYSNEECLRIRKDEQMKTMLRWMKDNRVARRLGGSQPQNSVPSTTDSQNSRFLTPDFIASINDVHGTPSQNAYYRLLGWLSRIPFDETELTELQSYFYDTGGGDGDRGSDGHLNLKLRGDLLAALDGEAGDELREEYPLLGRIPKYSVGMDLDKLHGEWNAWEALKGNDADPPPIDNDDDDMEDKEENDFHSMSNAEETDNQWDTSIHQYDSFNVKQGSKVFSEMDESESAMSNTTKERKHSKARPRISMFPLFEQQLCELKATATEMIEQEEDPVQHEIILTQYAEASLTILRQLRYHAMNSGLDGWRQSGLKRKILIVDDSNVTRKLVSRAFEKANFIVDTASNGKEGVEKLKASLYDIAFMDIDMPVMNGFEATKKLREWEDTMRPGARQPICALTATYVDDFERSELMKFKEAGLDVMESKPCNIPRLFKVVDDVSPMFSDLSITVMQRERSDHSFQSNQSF